MDLKEDKDGIWGCITIIVFCILTAIYIKFFM